MDTVIITGANGEPALSIARRLCELGMRVCALAGTIPDAGLGPDEFVPVPCDPTSPESVEAAVNAVLQKEKRIAGIVLAGQYLSEERFEAVSAEEIRLALNAQLVAPLCAVRLVLPSLIENRGHAIVVSPGAGTGAARALNAAADAATRAFAGALFAELRDTGVKTCHILLQGNEGAPDPAARFTTAPQSRIHADIVADAVETVFRLRENNALTQMILRPQATRETPHIPVSAEPKIRALQAVQLPPAKNFPPEETPIPTPRYRRPDYAPKKVELPAGEREDDGFADDYVDPELRYLLKNPQQNRQPPQPRENGDGNGAPSERENSGGRESRNRRRRRNRNKNKNFDGAIRVNAPQLGGVPAEKRENVPQQENAAAPAREENPPENSPAPQPQREAVPEEARESLPAKEAVFPQSRAEETSFSQNRAEEPAKTPDVPAQIPPAPPREQTPAEENAAAPAEAEKPAAKRPRKPRKTSAADGKAPAARKPRAPRKKAEAASAPANPEAASAAETPAA